MNSLASVTTTILLASYIHAGPPREATGYVINRATGHGYKLVPHAQPWERAVAVCQEGGAKLAVPKTQEEFSFIQTIVRGIQYPSIVGSQYPRLAWLGISNHGDYTLWKNVDGEDIKHTGFHTWAGQYNGQGFSNDPAEPHCAGLDASNLGLRDYWCNRSQPFICEIRV